MWLVLSRWLGSLVSAVGLLGRNVITVFSTVNNPAGRPVAVRRAGASGMGGDMCRPFVPSGLRMQRAHVAQWPGTSRGAGSSRMANFYPARCGIVEHDGNRRAACRRRGGRTDTRRSAGCRRTAMHKPICAKVRELPPAPRAMRARKNPRLSARVPFDARCRRRVSCRPRRGRRSRPDPAIPSAGRAPRVPPRRSSRRRRHPR